MSNKAEIAALKAYPNEMVTTCARGNKFRAGPILRRGFQEGYEQAEEDLIHLAQLWVDSGDANVMSFEQFLKFYEAQSNK